MIITLTPRSSGPLTFRVGVDDPEVGPLRDELLGAEAEVVPGPLHRRVRADVADAAPEDDALAEPGVDSMNNFRP
jgi:hypothetical protein